VQNLFLLSIGIQSTFYFPMHFNVVKSLLIPVTFSFSLFLSPHSFLSAMLIWFMRYWSKKEKKRVETRNYISSCFKLKNQFNSVLHDYQVSLGLPMDKKI
jgi:hypothetical protein